MVGTMRERFEANEEARLAPWAIRSSGSTRRYRVEDEGRAFDYRTHFQRDRDRIVYSRAFRRLRQKAQSGILPAYEDHRRNRLTHTLEVAQLARTIGRALALNEDLIEAVALAHDLGQPPFGPAGAQALDDLLSGRLDGHGGPGLGDLGGFCRARQSLRTVDLLEKRYHHPGLNLTDGVREGILKSGPDAVRPADATGLREDAPRPFEIQVLVLADRMAEALHDLDDALQSGAVDVASVERLRAVQELRRKLGASYRPRASRFMKANAIHRGLTHLLVTATILAGQKSLERWAARHGVSDGATFLAVRDRAVRGVEVALPAPASSLLEELELFLDGRVRRGFEADRVNGRGRRIVLGLFAAYLADPRLLEPHVLFRFKELTRVRYLRDLPAEAVETEIATRYRPDPRFTLILADYVCGMTDSFAVHEHAKLLEMGAVPIPGAEQLRRERP